MKAMYEGIKWEVMITRDSVRLVCGKVRFSQRENRGERSDTFKRSW